MDELLTFLVKTLVEDEASVAVEKEEDDNSITYRVKVAAADLGKVIGKNGRVANSIRTVVRSLARNNNSHVVVKFEDKI